MIKKASEVIASGDECSIVDFAIDLNRRASACSSELEQLKKHLREMARSRMSDQEDSVGDLTFSDQENSVILNGSLGVATIVFTEDIVKTKKGANLRDIEVNLSPETFAQLFTREVVIRPVKDFQERLRSLSLADRAVLEHFLQIKPSTPKVNLPR